MVKRLAVVVMCVALVAPPADAATYSISMRDSYFTPKTLTAPMGSAFRWTNTGEMNHSTTIARALVTGWNKTLVPGATWSRRIPYAGTFRYYCVPHGTPQSRMYGTIKVPASVYPRSGTRSTVFGVRAATLNAPSGWVYDLQRKKGSGSWMRWRTGTRTARHTFKAGSLGSGTYYFRARLRRLSNGATSSWSPPARISVS